MQDTKSSAVSPAVDIDHTTDQIRRFIPYLFEPDDIVELRFLPGKSRAWHFAKEVSERQNVSRFLALNLGGKNIYFGANPRLEKGGGEAEHVALARCLFADFDKMDEQDCRKRWESAGLPEPTIVLNSGRGVHAYWRLDTPMDDLAEWSKVQKSLIAAVGSDKSIHDPPRIMRLPGFQNCKYQDRPPCFIISANGVSYDVEYLRGIFAPYYPDEAVSDSVAVSSNGTAVADRAQRYLAKIPPAVSGEHGHDRTFNAACVLCLGFNLSVDEARPLLSEWNQSCQPPWTAKELEHKLVDAAKQPGERGYLLKTSKPTRKGKGKANLPPIVIDGSDAALLSLEQPAGRTDQANARRFLDSCAKDCRYVPAWNKWLVWDGTRWAIDDGNCRVQELAKQRFHGLWDEFAALVKERGKEITRDELGAIQTFIKRSNHKPAIRDALELAKSDPRVCISHRKLDQTPWLFNIKNGTIDLRTGELREHKREDLITKLAPVVFDVHADCPKWKQFLKVINNGDDLLIDYKRRAVGSCLASEIREHVLWFCHGSGSNGKSTFFEVLLEIFGDYGIKAARDLLIQKRGEKHPTELTDLHGVRLVASVEADEGGKLNETLVKELTGGDTIRARRMYENHWQFKPSHKIWLAANHKPIVQGTDHGIWRRLKLIPFEVKIPDEQQDRELPAKLKAEASGILNWMISGCLDWQKEGLKEPDKVSDASKAYQTEMDVLLHFVAECCIENADAEVKASDIYKRYKHWAHENGFHGMTSTMFGRKLSERFSKVEKGDGTYYQQLGLLAWSGGDGSFKLLAN